MRYYRIIFLLIVLLFTVSCASVPRQPELSYQKNALHIEGDFTFDGMEMPLVIDIEAADLGADGRMLSRDAAVTVGEGSVLEGVRFELADGKLYVSSGELRIPLEDTASAERITDILSLFSVREECYHSAEESENGHAVSYRDGGNSVTVTLSHDGMPTKITASADGHIISADIGSIEIM